MFTLASRTRTIGICLVVAAVLAGCPGDPLAPGPSGGAGNFNWSTEQPLAAVMMLYGDENAAAAMKFAGDSMSGVRGVIPELFPHLFELIARDAEVAEEMLKLFDGQPPVEEDSALVLMAYALEQMGYTPGRDRLVSFLQGNITGDVPMTLAAVTHAVRGMLDLPQKESAWYLASEIEETIAAATGTLTARGRTKLAGEKKSCWREFVLLGDDGQPLVYPAGHALAGQPITVGGRIQPSDAEVPDKQAGDERYRVEHGEGTYVAYTDPESGVTYEGAPSRLFNCAGFAFRYFNDGMKWTADPAEWFDALNSAGALEKVSSNWSASAGNFVFYYGDGNLPAHVAVVDSNPPTGRMTVINADRWSGLFTAPVNAAYFFGNWGQSFGYGLEKRYDHYEVWRWKNGQPPRFTPFIQREKQNSCHGEDQNGDGFPELSYCLSATAKCIDPEFAGGDAGGSEPEPGYRVYLLPQIGRGQLEVREEGSESQDIPLCQFSGGGLDCTVMAVLQPITEAFPSAEEAVLSICDRVTNLAYLPLGIGPAGDLDGTSRYLSGYVYGLLQTCGP
ncbi:MAG: hypothetical protein KKB50_18100 [Planctomycetes bacterium]|nr:hypothetical protein [Planctomycetota bacterium]